jgi:hypothetical protein
MTKEKTLTWTGYASEEEIKDYMENSNEGVDGELELMMSLEQARESINDDYDYWKWQWEDFTDYLTELMGEQKYWRDDATNMGWQNRTGFKVFEAKNGQEFINVISPDTDCHYEITPHGKGFKIRLSHHDAPMGEHHLVTPMTEENYNLAS